MKKFILMALAGTAIALAAPEFASATPLAPLGAAADTVSSTEQVWHRRWHRRWYRHRCYHRRHWSGRRCW